MTSRAADGRREHPATVTASREGAEIVVRIAVPVSGGGGVADELVAFPFGLEVAAARALVRDGVLKAAKLGRRLYARRSDVLALVDRLAPTNTQEATADPIEAAYAEMTRNAAAGRPR